jgi:2-methylcitrate dehydratase PrpD
MRGDSMTLRLASRLTELRYEQLPADVLGMAKLLMSDTLLVAAAGQTSPLARSLRSAVSASMGNCHAWFVEDAPPMGPVEATFINAFHAAALGYGSINAKVHADLVCLPAAWAMAEHLGSSTAELILAFVAAIEIVGRLSHSATSRSAGWSHTSIYGGIGAAVAAGLLLKLTPEQLAHAMGLAMAQAAGTQQASLESVGSRRLQPAFAARNGIFAAQLAAAGATAPSQAMEGRFGLRALYESGDDKQVLKDLWSDWRLLETSLKPYPISACSQAAVEAVLNLQRLHGCAEEDMLEVVAYVSPFMFRYVGAEFNLDGDLEMLAQFNLRYHLASVLLRGPITFADLRPQALKDAAVARVLRKVHLRVDPNNNNDFAPVAVSFTLRDGRVLDYVQQHPPGSRQQPMTSAALAFKAQQCGDAANIDGVALLDSMAQLEQALCLKSLVRIN